MQTTGICIVNKQHKYNYRQHCIINGFIGDLTIDTVVSKHSRMIVLTAFAA